MAVSQSLTLTCLRQDAAANTSAVRILWQSTQTNDSHNDNTRTAYYYISVNGGTEKAYSVSYTLPLRKTATVLDTTVTVPHNGDGTGSVSVRTWMDTRISAGVVELDKSLTLPQIPRESTIGATDAYIGSNTAITVSRKNSAYTHSIALKFGTEAFYLKADGGTSADEVKFSQESVSFPIPTRFYDRIPTSKSGVCTLTLKTYSGSTAVGSAKTCTFSVMAKEADCRPTVSGTVTDGNSITAALTGDTAKLIRYASTAVCGITANAGYGTSLKEKTVNGTAVTDSIAFSEVTADSFVFSATDGRGYVTSQTVKPTVIPYVPLTCTVTAGRTDPTSGHAVLTVEGQYYDGSFGAKSNTLTVSYQIGGGDRVSLTPTVSGGKYSARVQLADLDYTKEYTITVTAKDEIRTLSPTAAVGKGIPVFDWGETDFRFHVPVNMPAGSGFHGVAADANLCSAPGTYRLNAGTQNCPITNGMLIVFSVAEDTFCQLALNYSATERKMRMMWYGTFFEWLTV